MGNLNEKPAEVNDLCGFFSVFRRYLIAERVGLTPLILSDKRFFVRNS